MSLSTGKALSAGRDDEPPLEADGADCRELYTAGDTKIAIF